MKLFLNVGVGFLTFKHILSLIHSLSNITKQFFEVSYKIRKNKDAPNNLECQKIMSWLLPV